MDTDLKLLEQKLSQLISLCESLRDENSQLRLDLTTLKLDAELLKTNMSEASKRIEALMETLPT